MVPGPFWSNLAIFLTTLSSLWPFTNNLGSVSSNSFSVLRASIIASNLIFPFMHVVKLRKMSMPLAWIEIIQHCPHFVLHKI